MSMFQQWMPLGVWNAVRRLLSSHTGIDQYALKPSLHLEAVVDVRSIVQLEYTVMYMSIYI